MNLNQRLLIHSCIFFFYWLFFLFSQSTSLYGGDAGDLVTAAYTGGIAHPPGYPLYSFIGYIFSHIPLGTIAWRVSLLSSIPSALTLTLLTSLIFNLTGSKIAAIVAPSTLGATYIFWLYSSVPEVFSLHLMFILLILYISFSFAENPTFKTLLMLSGVMGLSLTHHHTILFIFPICALVVIQKQKYLQSLTRKHIAYCICAFLIGLSPYIWAYIAALRIAPIVWDDPVTLKNFIRLISRADYGSFQSGFQIGNHIASRLIQIPALINFYIEDFRVFGVVLSIIGTLNILILRKKEFVPYILGFVLTGPVYFFYASYLLTSNFNIAIAERFVLPSYIFVTILMGFGIGAIVNFIASIRFTQIIRIRFIILLLSTVLLCTLPISLIKLNAHKISALKYDRTAENFGRDILQTVPQNSILLLLGDQAVFNTQYMYYAANIRPDVKIIQLTKLVNGTLYRHLEKYYPEITFPRSAQPIVAVAPFLERSYSDYPIYSTIPFTFIPDGYTWIPYGLLYRLYKETNLPTYSTVSTHSQAVWGSYQDPLAGSLGIYENLMLSNISDHYRNASIQSGLYALTQGNNPTHALRYYNYALKLDKTSSSIWYLKGDAYLALQQCAPAHDAYERAHKLAERNLQVYYSSMYSLYEDCYNDAKKASYWKKQRDTLEQKKEILLQDI